MINTRKVAAVLKAPFCLLVAMTALTVLFTSIPNHIDRRITGVFSARTMASLTLNIPHRANIIGTARTTGIVRSGHMA